MLVKPTQESIEDEDNIYQIDLGLTVAEAGYIYWGLVSLEDGNSPMFQNPKVIRSIKDLRGYIDSAFNEVLDMEREQIYLETYNPRRECGCFG